MTKLSGHKTSLSKETTGPQVSFERPTFTVAESVRRYPDGNIPDMPGAVERRVRKLARRRLAKIGIVYQAPKTESESHG